MDLNLYPSLPRRMDFRIGILGSGFIVNDCHLVAYRKAGFNPVAIASRTRDNAVKVAQRHSIAKVFDSYEQLLNDPTIEVLDIAVPPNALLELIKKACERRTVKGILAQKPLGMNYAEAVEAVTACEAAGITLAVNQNMRYDHSVRAAKTLLENGTIGDPILATIDMRGIPHWQPWQKDLGWVTLRIMSIHHLDAFRYWFGEPLRIFCSTRPDPRTPFPHTDGICTYILEYASGLRCVAIDDTWTGPAKEGCAPDIHIKWRIEGLNGLAIGNLGWCQDPYTTASTIQYASKGQHGFQAPIWPESWFPDAFIGTMANLLVALENGTQPAIGGRDNLKTMALVDAAYLSAKEHRAVVPGQIQRNKEDPSKPDRKEESVPRWKSKLQSFFGFKEPGAPPPESPASNFTPDAVSVLALARKEAGHLQHDHVSTEHVLLGLIKLGQCTAIRVLTNLGVVLETVRMEVEKQIGTGPAEVPHKIPFAPRVKKVLALAVKEARTLNHTYTGTEHILLGLLREGNGPAARILKKSNLDIVQTRAEILKVLGRP
jgi:predicted dehydrogenase